MKKKRKWIATFLSLIFLVTAISLPSNGVVHADTGAIISRIAGTTTKQGISGYTGDNGLATSAALKYPGGVAVGSSGNVYIADSSNNVIRKIDYSTGNITTIAGTGVSGYSGDGGLATSATLKNPSGVAVDSSENVYIVDTNNNVIRKIDHATGNINTIAGTGTSGYSGDGGLATSAKFRGPEGVAVDSSGNIYVADVYNQAIRKIDHSTGNISTIAGTGVSGYSGDGGLATSATLKNPSGVAVGSSGNVYIADTNNSVIRKIDHFTGNISTIAGTGTSGYSGDNSLATSATLKNPIGIAVDSSENIYVSDVYNQAIRKIDHATGNISTIAGTGAGGYSGNNGLATSATLNYPMGLAVDNSGNVYIADYSNQAIRKIDFVTGNISTIAGIAKDVAANAYSGDGGLATSAALSNPMGVVADSSGNVYIADSANNVIRKIDHTTGNISTIAGTGTAGYGGDNGLATSAKLNMPSGVAVDSSGNVYIADTNNSTIRKIDDTTGNISTIAGIGTAGYSGDGGLATSAALRSPNGVAIDNSGNVYIADSSNNVVRKIDHTTGNISTIAGTGTRDYSGDNGLATSATLYGPREVAIDNSENVYIADSGNNVIRKIDHTTGNISTIAGTGTRGYSGDNGLATSATLNTPSGVAVDSSGNVYLADSGNSAIRKIDHETGTISTIAGNGTSAYGGDNGLATSATLTTPFQISVDSSGNVYIADKFNHEIRKISMPISSYTVTYNGNGNTNGTVPTDSNSYTSGTSVTAKDSGDLAKTNYKFAGWNTSQDGTGTAVAAWGSFNITESTTLYAQWEKIVPASGLTVTVAPEATPVKGKVNLTVTPAADGINHKILYRIVDSNPEALNVGDDVEPSDGWIEITDTNAQEISVANGKYIEAVEVEWGVCTAIRWGKSEVVNDGYVEPSSSSLDKTTVNFDKNPAKAQDISINMTLNGNTLNGIKRPEDVMTSGLIKGTDYEQDGNVVTIKKSYLQRMVTGTIVLVFNFSAGESQFLNVIVTDTTSNDVSINPTTANFDKSAANQADVNISMGIGKYDLKNISGNGGYLPDDVLQGNTLTIKKSDLGKITSVAELTFGDEKGNTEGLIVTKQAVDAGVISNIVLTPNGGFGQTELTSITNEGNTLVKGTDYIVNGSQVTIKKGFLTKLGTGTVNLVLNFDKEHLAVTMSTNETEITATVTLYKNTLTSITNGAYTLVNGKDYTVNGNNVTIKKDYLGTLSTGTASLALNFSEGGSQTLNVAVTDSTIKTHKVTFEDYDGSPIGEVQTVDYGESATAPAAPTRTGYVFAGWDKNFDNVTGDLVVKATYTSGNTYPFQSTTDKDGSGETKISTDYLKSRDNTLVITNPTADLAIPASAIDLVDGADHIKVTEKVVTPETNTVQGLFSNLPSGVVKMIGNPINLNVQLLKADDTTVVKEIHQFGNNQKVKVTIKLTPNQILGLDTSTLSMYYYDETSNVWDPIGGSFDPNTNEFTFYTPHFTNFAIMDKVSAPPPTVTSYTVTFKDYDGTVIGTPQAVNYGGSATAPVAPVREGYTFTGWDKTFNNVTGNLVVTAQYSINNYTVTFKDYDGKTIGDVQTVKYGESATAPAAPIRTGYVFAGWDKTFDKVTGDLVVTATYKSGNTYNFKPTTTNTGDETKIPVDYLTSRDNTLVITSGNTEISIPAGAIDLADGTGYIKVTEQSEAAAEVSKQFGSLPKGLNQVGTPLLLSIQLFDANNNYIKDVHKLGNNEKIKVTMKFTPDQLKGVISGRLTMYYYDETAKSWNKLEGSFDSNTMEMTFYMTTL